MTFFGKPPDNDDKFASFTIYSGQQEVKSKNRTAGSWIPLASAASIKNYTCNRGGIYCGGRLPSLDGYGTEASLIDDSLSVTSESMEYKDESLGYWPKYITISDRCRGAFLSWLASERSNPSVPLGYVFIYFYGLERRVVVDSIQSNVQDDEFRSIFEEIIRLQKIYGRSGSFRSYSNRLLEIMCLLRPGVVTCPELERNPKQDSVLLKYRLAKIVNENKPVPANLALAWLKTVPGYSLKKPARRCVFEFGQLFSRLYKTYYGEGIIVKPNKTRLRIDYRPASSSLRGIKIPLEDLPDPSGLSGPANKLIALAEECTNALEPYSRYLGKEGSSRTNLAAILLLPEQLNDIASTLGLGKLNRWAKEVISNRGGLCDVKELWTFTKTPCPAKLSKRDLDLLQSLIDKIGVGMAPDARFHHAKLTIDGKIVLFAEGHGSQFVPSKAFDEMSMAIRLGAMIAAIDFHIHNAEHAMLNQFVESDSSLSPIEKRSLKAYLLWQLETPANITGIKARLDRFGTAHKTAISQMLVRIAVADGKIMPSEIKQLEKLYGMLGLDKAFVTRDIHALTATKTSKVMTTDVGEPLEAQTENGKGFSLDESILAIHDSQTKEVQEMLSAIFASDDEPIEDASIVDDAQDSTSESQGIDSQYYALYEMLIGRDRWSRKEVEELCRNLGLMLAGAIEAINDWAYEKVAAPVLEEHPDSIYVDQVTAEELEG